MLSHQVPLVGKGPPEPRFSLNLAPGESSFLIKQLMPGAGEMPSEHLLHKHGDLSSNSSTQVKKLGMAAHVYTCNPSIIRGLPGPGSVRDPAPKLIEQDTQHPPWPPHLATDTNLPPIHTHTYTTQIYTHTKKPLHTDPSPAPYLLVSLPQTCITNKPVNRPLFQGSVSTHPTHVFENRFPSPLTSQLL